MMTSRKNWRQGTISWPFRLLRCARPGNMGWDDSDDDDWGDDDIEKKLEEQKKEKEKQRRRDEGLESESEDEPPPQPKAAPAQKPKPKPKAKPEPVEPEPVLSKQEQKLRLRKLEEEASSRLANDLFSGFEKPQETLMEQEQREKKEREEAAKKAAKPKVVYKDAFDNVSLDVQADVESLCATCVTKIEKGEKGKARGGSIKFLADCLKQLEDVLDMKELTEMEKLLAELVKQKKANGASVYVGIHPSKV